MIQFNRLDKKRGRALYETHSLEQSELASASVPASASVLASASLILLSGFDTPTVPPPY